MQNPIVLLIICVIGYFFIWPKIKEFQAKQKAIESVAEHKTNEVTAIVQKKGQKARVTINLQTIADGIFYAFYQEDGSTRWNEDEELASNYIKGVPDQYVPQLAVIYAQKGKDLYRDLRSKLSAKEYSLIANKLD